MYHNECMGKKGFTLVELLTVIGIIGVMTGAALFLINPVAQLNKSRDAKRKADLQQIRAALELYRSDYGHYPRSNWVNSTQGDSWIRDSDPAKPLTPQYLKVVPKDAKNVGGFPWTVGSYTYAYQSVTVCGIQAGASYILTTRLENTSDTEINNNIQYGSCSWPAVAGYSGLYTVSSP
jgi:prepilin-type N-terminal cleavage/methylation domain-containing protein